MTHEFIFPDQIIKVRVEQPVNPEPGYYIEIISTEPLASVEYRTAVKPEHLVCADQRVHVGFHPPGFDPDNCPACKNAS